MKTLPISRRALSVVFALAFASSLHAQSNNAARTPPALGLLRLRNEARSGDAAPLLPEKFSVDDLSPNGVRGASKGRRHDVDYLSLEANAEWSRPLRGSGDKALFVSFQAHGSQSTVIRIGGAWIGLTASPAFTYLQIMAEETSSGSFQWKELNLHVPVEQFEGRPLAMLPVITVRLDPRKAVWDLYSDAKLLAINLPLVASGNEARHFFVKAGEAGAWLSGLVVSDDNPLYEDENENGIDDAFEKRTRFGQILPAGASPIERSQLAAEWIALQARERPPALFLKRPLSDRWGQ